MSEKFTAPREEVLGALSALLEAQSGLLEMLGTVSGQLSDGDKEVKEAAKELAEEVSALVADAEEHTTSLESLADALTNQSSAAETAINAAVDNLASNWDDKAQDMMAAADTIVEAGASVHSSVTNHVTAANEDRESLLAWEAEIMQPFEAEAISKLNALRAAAEERFGLVRARLDEIVQAVARTQADVQVTISDSVAAEAERVVAAMREQASRLAQQAVGDAAESMLRDMEDATASSVRQVFAQLVREFERRLRQAADELARGGEGNREQRAAIQPIRQELDGVIQPLQQAFDGIRAIDRNTGGFLGIG